MAFVVEDGTGKTDANSYVSLAEFRAYWLDRGTDYSLTADATLQSWLVLATDYADTMNWSGVPYSETQALLIPRESWYDNKTGTLLDNTVPDFLKNGVCEIANILQSSSFETEYETGLKSESYGPVSVTYAGDSGDAKKVYPTAMKWFIRGMQPTGLRGVPL